MSRDAIKAVSTSVVKALAVQACGLAFRPHMNSGWAWPPVIFALEGRSVNPQRELAGKTGSISELWVWLRDSASKKRN